MEPQKATLGAREFLARLLCELPGTYDGEAWNPYPSQLRTSTALLAMQGTWLQAASLRIHTNNVENPVQRINNRLP